MTKATAEKKEKAADTAKKEKAPAKEKKKKKVSSSPLLLLPCNMPVTHVHALGAHAYGLHHLIQLR